MGWNTNPEHRKQRVLIIGAGAAGMACAATLAKRPERFDVTVLEKNSIPGGLAMSLAVDGEKFGADWANTGAQGGTRMFRHSYKFFREYGYEPKEVRIQLSFGKGKDGFWTNMFPTPLLQRHQHEIEKFGRALRAVRHFPFPLWIVPLKRFLWLFGLSREFGYRIVYPITSLLMGIGNEAEDVPCGILVRLFEDPEMKIWDYDPVGFMPARPPMFAFPNMTRFYMDWASGLRAKGVTIRLNTQAVKIIQRNERGIIVETRQMDEDARVTEGSFHDRSMTEEFDKLVLCVPGDEAKRILGETATWREKWILGGVKYYDDITITHCDHNYFENRYEPRFKEELCAKPRTKEQEEQIKFAKGEAGIQSGFRPSYCTFSYHSRPGKNELAFDYSNFQYQFLPEPGSGTPPIPLERHVFQSRFLGENLKGIWTIDQIDDKAVLERRWIHQPSQGWKHYIRVLPYLRYINGKNNTIYAGAWTFANMHEAACITGIAAAVRLGVEYESLDDFADKLFSLYLRAAHGKTFKRKTPDWFTRRRGSAATNNSGPA
ncbi:hypothetical protein D8B26_000731 [Coccidioides posadasii str. Silveira]|uniref:Uncharacterized protein n=1 Tax=Coccidioides posadasii (strain RMSCC 757 / Silveira) TaxID=443226 RepID=E9CSF9_COCPS|nr:conserved hypothetical protein [Coccidioides posadasii str. Silveira]QVM06019.1 hypothetical protein D8B26_000731 [Coccidioides posadasii str. Silveira]